MIDINEVIYGLEFTKAMITFNPSTGEDIEPEDLNDDDKITYDACVGAITLLKKQEPQPILEVEDDDLYAWSPEDVSYYCPHPECGKEISYNYNFCPYCGQAVKWNDKC